VTLDIVLQVVDGLGALSLPYEVGDFLLFYLWHTDQKVCKQSVFSFEVTIDPGNSLWRLHRWLKVDTKHLVERLLLL